MAKNIVLRKFSTVERWMNTVLGSGISSSPTEKNYLHFLRRFCDFTGMNPDELIAERRVDLKSDDALVQRRHEEMLLRFQKFLEPQLARSSIGTAQRVVKSFYSANYSQLNVKPPKTWASTRRSVPRPDELKAMVESCEAYRDKAIIMFLAQTGMGKGDLPLVNLGLVKDELKQGVSPLHLRIMRKKTMIEYDTFLGKDGITYLKLYLAEKPPEGDYSPIFDITPRTIEHIVKNSSLKVGVKPYVTPHKLRSFFETYLTLAKVPTELVNYWMGHSVAYGGAYFVPPVDSAEGLPSQRGIYAENEHVLSISES